MSNVDQNPEKPVEQWVTGDEPITGPQQSYLETLAREAGEDVPDGLTKAEASQLIERLQSITGRGDPDGSSDSVGQGRDTPVGSQGDQQADAWIDQTMAEGDIANGEGNPDDRPLAAPSGD
jgi:hypothetical protein